VKKRLIGFGCRLSGGSARSKDEAGSWRWRLSHGKGQFWGGCSASIVTNADLLRSCVKMHETIEVPFGVLSGISPGIGVLDRVHIPISVYLFIKQVEHAADDNETASELENKAMRCIY